MNELNKLITKMNESRGLLWTEEDKDEFGKMIVRECIDLLREESERLYGLSSEETDELFASNFQICAEKCWDNEAMIKEHFGVE